ncbi:ATP-binding cassette domain-containing protein [Patescibacteria group bacterium]|nr:ATP-binding cassette domain-containing protein [Patescibacteria group bacterium]
MPIITIKNLSKSFIYHKKAEGLRGSIKALFKREKLTKDAVKNISFSINKGEFVGFLGPNGAGKTTTLKMLSGILYPTHGSIIVGGHNPAKRESEFKKKISIVMGQKAQLWPSLPAIETFTLIQKMYELDENNYRNRLNELANLMDVEDILNVQVRKLSLGQRMKCELIASLLHNPKILFLDEPTIGLDIVSQKKIREFLKEYNQKFKTTIILTSHYMDDVQDLCKRLIIINDGQIGYDGSIKDIIEEYSKDKNIHVIFRNKILKRDLSKIGKVYNYEPYEAKISIPMEEANKKISLLINKFPVKDINIKDVTLEEIVEDIFKNK